MTQRSHSRGWPIEYRYGEWVYSDTLTSICEERPCKRCGMNPTEEGHDACLGVVTGVSSACCGHGAEQPFRVAAKEAGQ
jgi:hypothetical protein